jgi:hypothetical protein
MKVKGEAGIHIGARFCFSVKEKNPPKPEGFFTFLLVTTWVSRVKDSHNCKPAKNT